MMAIQYHPAQIEVQTEANTRPIADALSNWVGPVVEFCRSADMFVFAVPGADDELRFSVVSGKAPLVRIAQDRVLIDTQGAAVPGLHDSVSCGGLAISLAVARRARLNGELSAVDGGLSLLPVEAFTNCRKYIAPSEALADELHLGPVSREAVELEHAWVRDVLAVAETSFLASISPQGIVDVSHRGGPAGFLRLEPAQRSLTWDEYAGDGMFKSAGNVRASGRLSLLVPDLASGDAVELHARARFETVRLAKRPRTSGLEQHRDPYPVQGHMVCEVIAAYRLKSVTLPRRRLVRRQKVTSDCDIEEQAPR